MFLHYCIAPLRGGRGGRGGRRGHDHNGEEHHAVEAVRVKPGDRITRYHKMVAGEEPKQERLIPVYIRVKLGLCITQTTNFRVLWPNPSPRSAHIWPVSKILTEHKHPNKSTSRMAGLVTKESNERIRICKPGAIPTEEAILRSFFIEVMDHMSQMGNERLTRTWESRNR